MVKSALTVQERLEALVRESRGMSPEQFKAAYERFLTDVQTDL
jgi:hypothetical protein